MTAKNTIDDPCASYAQQYERWRPIVHLRGGTLAMREARETYLPKEKGESPEEYNARLKRSVSRGMHKSAVKRLTSRPFSRPVQVGGDDTLPEQLQWIEQDCDMEGTNLTRFGLQLAIDAWNFGRTHFFVDYPSLDGPISLAAQTEQGIRPYFSFVPALSLIGWRYGKRPSGAVRLDEIRIRSDSFVPAANEAELPWDEEGERSVMLYRRAPSETEDGGDGPARVLWERWAKRDSEETFSMVGNGVLSDHITEIPLVSIYFNRTGFLDAEPPLEDLAWVDVAHWQSGSDQRNILRYARVPMLYMTGVDNKAMNEPTPIGASRTLKSTNAEARFGFVEPAGQAIKSGEEDLRHLEEVGEALGSAPMTQRSGNIVATAKAIDEAGVNSDAQAAIRACEMGLSEGYEWAATWVKTELPEDFKIDIYSEFDLSTGRAEDMKALEFDYSQQLITRETFLRERRRRGVYTESMDPAVEIALAEAEERPMLGIVQDDDGEFGGDDTGDDAGAATGSDQ